MGKRKINNEFQGSGTGDLKESKSESMRMGERRGFILFTQ